MKNTWKRMLSLLLVLCLCVGMFPAAALAEDAEDSAPAENDTPDVAPVGADAPGGPEPDATSTALAFTVQPADGEIPAGERCAVSWALSFEPERQELLRQEADESGELLLTLAEELPADARSWEITEPGTYRVRAWLGEDCALSEAFTVTEAVLLVGDVTPDGPKNERDVLPTEPEADEIQAASGSLGDSITWTLSDSGVLTISGTGPMPDWYMNYNIGYHPFYSRRSFIKTVVIKNGVTSIGDLAFYYCDLITSVTIPSSIKTIGEEAFWHCRALTSVSIPSGVTSIGAEAFADCVSLKSVTIPYNVKTIGEAMCIHCSALSDVYYGGSKSMSEFLKGRGWEENNDTLYNARWHYSMSAGALTIASGSCGDNLTWKLSDSGKLTISGTGAMKNWTDSSPPWCDIRNYIKMVDIENGVTSIGGMAFWDCDSLTSITIPISVTSIGAKAFRNCDSLTSITVPKSVTSIGVEAFANCTALRTVIFDGEAPQIGKNAFLNVQAELFYFYGCGSFDPVIGPYGGTLTWRPRDGYPVRYDANGGHGAPEAQIKIWGEALTLSTDVPNREGHDFLGWAKSAQATHPYYQPGDTYETEAAVILYAVWRLKTYVRYDANGGEDAPENQIKIWGQPLTLTTDKPVRDGFVFLGWAESPNAPAAAYQPGGVYEGNAELTLYAMWGEARILSEPLLLDREYLILTTGQEVQLTLPGLTSVWMPFVTWSVEDAEPGSTAPIRVEDGLVRAVAPGSAWVKAELIVADTVLAARCRVDVVAEKQGESGSPIARDVTWNGLRLVNTKATAELFKTDYTRIEIVPVLSQNKSAQSNVIPQSPETPEGVGAVKSARFANAAADELFLLRVVDDRTLEIVPRDSAVLLGESKPSAIKGSYKSAILVNVDGKELETEALTLTVKKTKPSVKVGAVKLNSAFRWDEQPLVFTGGTITALEVTNTLPNWLTMDRESMTLGYYGLANAKNSAKLTVLVTLDGWAIRKELKLSVSSAPTDPKISPKAATLTLLPVSGNQVSTTVKVSPAVYTDSQRFPITVSRIEEAKVGSFENGSVLDAEIVNGVLTVRPGPALDSAKAHTFKLYLSVNGKEKAVTVKTTALKTPALTVKAAGFVDSALPGSSITLTATAKSYFGLCQPVLRVQKTKAATKTSPAVDENVTGLFVLASQAGQGMASVTLRAADPTAIEKGYTYTAYLRLRLPDGSETAESKVKLNLKWSDPAKLKASATVKATGFLDVLRPGTAVTLKPTVKNCCDFVLTPGDLTVTRTYDGSAKAKVSEDWTNRFTVRVEDGVYCISIREGAAVSHADKFTVTADINSPSAGTLSAKAVTLTVKQGSVKLTQSVKSVKLLKDDRFSRGVVTLTPTDSALRIARVELDSASLARFELIELENGSYAIGYAGNRLSGTKAATVKLRVFLEGNLTATPNATISVKVTIG